jgi:hypothetical protein
MADTLRLTITATESIEDAHVNGAKNAAYYHAISDLEKK